ncbi:hypothetical protein PilKf_00697 [Pillotina sp. SPG140]|jgi:hypothetical protein
MLEYTLEYNELTEEPGDLRARVVNVRSYTEQELIDKILQIGAGLTRSDVVSVLEAMKQVTAGILADGGAVHTELFNASPSIQGVFNAPDETYNADKHKISINFHIGSGLRKAVADIKVKKVIAVSSGTIIISVTDIKTGSVNGTLTPGRDLKITGVKIKIAGDDPDVGLYFVPASGTPVKADPSDFVINNPSEVIALIPALTPGTWQVRIVTQYSGSKDLKTPRTVTFDKDLTVTAP